MNGWGLSKIYVKEVNNDEKEFQLKDENSILDTYEWVMNVLESLRIRFILMENN